ncbi:transposase, partial [Limosilactobacillus reuteri]
EPVFGRMKRDFGVRRTHLRGQQAVENDVGLTLMALNLTKLGKTINQLSPFLVNNQKCELQFLIKSKIIVRIFLVRSQKIIVNSQPPSFIYFVIFFDA